MKSAAALLMVAWLAGAAASSPQATAPRPGQSAWTGKGPRGHPPAEPRSVFSPRMDYDEWTPLGRGDPLKNDPTYDYVPPVLERVHYWMDPSKRTPDPPLADSGLLVLGSRTESAFATQPTTQRYQVFQSKETQADSRIDTSSLLDPFFKLMDVAQFNLNFNSDADAASKPGRIQRPHFQAGKQRPPAPQALQRPPYTMLVPPPPPPPPPPAPRPTAFVTTTRTQQTTAPVPPAPRPPPAADNATTVDPNVLANTENVFKPVAISMPAHGEPENGSQNFPPPVKLLPTPPPPPPATTTTTVTVTKQQRVPATPHLRLKVSPRPGNEIHSVTKPAKAPPRPGDDHRATTVRPVTPTRPNALTTDPTFKHYKQPSEPARGPFYLIIQGHSKVKTYGANKNPINGLLASNEIKFDEEEGRKTKFERSARKTRRRPLPPGEDHEIGEGPAEGADRRTRPAGDRSANPQEAFTGAGKGFPRRRRRKRFLPGNRRLLSEPEEDCPRQARNATEPPDNLDLESLIAISDDYDPADVADILLANEGSPGSGFGGLAASLLSRADQEAEEM